MLKQAIIVALGGAIGSVARYKIGGFILHQTGTWNFPVSTFCVNLFGCFAIGVLAALVEHHHHGTCRGNHRRWVRACIFRPAWSLLCIADLSRLIAGRRGHDHR